MTEPLRVLNLGWGVQSWTLAAMMALDFIPRADYLVHADTSHELEATYEFRGSWEPWLREHGLNIKVVHGTRRDVIASVEETGSVMIPAFTLKGTAGGQLLRQCTRYWKIRPVRQFIRAELKRQGRPWRVAHSAECILGISWDEIERLRKSDVQYIENVYPLIDRRITRDDCMAWLNDHGLPTPPKSACTFCPYRTRPQFVELRKADGSDWAEMEAVDAAIRGARRSRGFELFIHPRREPVAVATATPADSDDRQLGFEEAPCDSGMCWT